MERSPLLQAMLSRDREAKSVISEMSYAELSSLLTVMLTISVISILVLIISVSTVLGFIW